jgi:hypothetical protein
MPRRRDPMLLSQYICRFCGEQIVWGELLRLLRTDPGQPDYELRENYAHSACLRAKLRPEVPLTLARRWNGHVPYLDNRAEIEGQPCGFCGEAAAEAERTELRIQRIAGAIKDRTFDEESVPVHGGCLDGVGR